MPCVLSAEVSLVRVVSFLGCSVWAPAASSSMVPLLPSERQQRLSVPAQLHALWRSLLVSGPRSRPTPALTNPSRQKRLRTSSTDCVRTTASGRSAASPSTTCPERARRRRKSTQRQMTRLHGPGSCLTVAEFSGWWSVDVRVRTAEAC